MRKTYYNKLVRDKIPEIIKSKGEDCEIETLSQKGFETHLIDKLIEESKELTKVKGDEIIDELADILELVKSITSQNKIKYSTIEAHQEKKRKERGGFKKRIFLIWASHKQKQ